MADEALGRVRNSSARPSVGRIVHVHGTAHPMPLAAIVTGIADDESLWLHVMPPGGGAYDLAGIFQGGAQPARERGRPYWLWPQQT